ncbi:MAG: thioesterase family protein [Candidatus Melainabacteria bacterium]|nr:thioesterase family protein [Candidatus Melainabacteria bacterium]
MTTLSANKSRYQFEVHVFDTDGYGVMWHGAYLKWLEAARDKAVADCGIDLQTPNEGWVYPVAEQNLRFRKGAKLRDTVTIYTQVSIQGPRLRFHQTMVRPQAKESAIEETLLETVTTCVVCEATTFKPLRRIPAELQQGLAPIFTEASATV